MITDKDIQESVENCIWRKDVCGAWICTGDVVPCVKHINDGKCDTLRRLFAEDGDDE